MNRASQTHLLDIKTATVWLNPKVALAVHAAKHSGQNTQSERTHLCDDTMQVAAEEREIRLRLTQWCRLTHSQDEAMQKCHKQ